MAVTKIFIFQFLILATVHLLMAENDEGGLFGLPSGKMEAGMPDADLVKNLTSGDMEGEEHENRFFFHLFNTYLSTCNYTSNPGRSCLDCRHSQNCLASNESVVRTCHGFFRFCNNGACSLFPGSACNSTG